MKAFKQENGINFTVSKKASFPRDPQRNETTEIPCRLFQTTCRETHGWKQACLSTERLGLAGSSWGRLPCHPGAADLFHILSLFCPRPFRCQTQASQDDCGKPIIVGRELNHCCGTEAMSTQIVFINSCS